MDTHIKKRPNLLFCSAIEASGDALLAPLITALKSKDPAIRCIGIGGPLSVQAGLEIWEDPKPLVAHGLVEALGSVPRIWMTLRRLQKRLRTELTCTHWIGALLVDSPEINLRLKATCDSLHLPVAYLAPPQAWAWRSKRVKHFKKIAWLGCLFPFETDWWRQQGCTVYYVGHPLRSPHKQTSCDLTHILDSPVRHNQKEDTLHLAFFPGSRNSVVKRSFPLFIKALDYINKEPQFNLKHISIHLVQSTWVDPVLIDQYLDSLKKKQFPYIDHIQQHQSAHSALQCATHALCYAGTSTLEIALARCNFLAFAPLHPFSSWVTRHWIKVDHMALPNLILNQRAFAELHPYQCTPLHLGVALHTLLTGPAVPFQVWQTLDKRLSPPNWEQCAHNLLEQLMHSN